MTCTITQTGSTTYQLVAIVTRLQTPALSYTKESYNLEVDSNNETLQRKISRYTRCQCFFQTKFARIATYTVKHKFCRLAALCDARALILFTYTQNQHSLEKTYIQQSQSQ